MIGSKVKPFAMLKGLIAVNDSKRENVARVHRTAVKSKHLYYSTSKLKSLKLQKNEIFAAFKPESCDVPVEPRS
jgi:hypothetical protein